jgi:hypothetical protein
MDGWVKTTQGPAVPGAQVYVCTQPANVFPPATPPRSTPIPWAGPNPLANIFSDDGFTPIIQPITTDGFGHYDFYATPGLYTIVIVYGGTVQQYYIDQSLGNVGSSAGGSVLFSTNGTPNFNQFVQNLEQGSGIIISTDNFGNTTISSSGSGGIVLKTNGVLNGNQGELNLVNGSDISISQDGAGNVTIASSSLPSPDVARFSMWEASGVAGFNFYTINDDISVGNVGTSSVNAPTATTGTSVTMNKGGWLGEKFVWPTRNILFESIITLNVLGNSTVYFGLTDSATNGPTDPTTDDFIGIVYNGGTNWTLITSIAGSVHQDSSGDIPYVAGQRVRASVQASGGTARLYINGVQAGILSTLPTSNPLGMTWWSNGNGPTNTLNTIEYMYTTNATP